MHTNAKKTLKRGTLGVIIFLAILIIYNTCTYITKENEYSVVKQFNKIVTIKDSPGFALKIPFINTVDKVPNNIQFYDLPKSDVITSDKKTMIVDAYVLWNVTDAKTFTSALNADTKVAEGRINVIVYNAIKTTISKMTQEELIISRDDVINVSADNIKLDDIEIQNMPNNDSVMTGNAKVINISEELLKCIGSQCEQYGINISEVKIKILDLPDANRDAVYNRMVTERENIAAAYTAQGESEAKKIRNTTSKEVEIKLSEAKAKADKTIAEGEAEYMRILSNAYNNAEKADFYLYARSLDTAKKTLKNNKSTTLFIDKDNPIAKIFQGSNK